MHRLIRRTKYRRMGWQPEGSSIIYVGGNAFLRAARSLTSQNPLDVRYRHNPGIQGLRVRNRGHG